MIRHLALAVVCAGALAAADAVDRALDPAGESLAGSAQDLMRAVDGLPADQQPAALGRIAASRVPAAGETLRHYLDGHEPALAIAAIRGLGAAWPTTPGDAEAVRTLIRTGEATLADAASAFAAQVGDDRAIPLLIARLDREPASEATIRALLALTGHSAENVVAWNDWWHWHGQAAKGMIDHLAAAISSGNAKRIDDALVPLLGERRGASAIADLLIQAADHSDPAVAEAARAGLATCPGPVAACWRAQHPALPVVPAVLAVAEPVASLAPAESPLPPKHLGVWTLAIALGTIGAFSAVACFTRLGTRRTSAEESAPESSGKKPRISVTFASRTAAWVRRWRVDPAITDGSEQGRR